MAQIETWLACDLQKPVEVVPLKGHLFSADVNGNKLGVRITNNGLPNPVSGTLILYGLRHDGVTVVTRQNVSDSYTPSIILAGDFYNVVGPIQLVLRLVSGNDETVLAACTSYVYKTTSSQLIDSGSAVPDMETLIARIDDCERAAAAANTAAANAQSQVNAAASSASAAQTAAQNAQTAAQAAQTRADNAESSASNAATQAAAAATSASTAATQAAAAASSASGAATDAAAAATAAQTAQTQATNAANSASTAQGQVATAQSAVSAAAASAAAAQSSAADAATQASAARTSAATAVAAADAATLTANNANTTANQVSAAFSDALPNIVQNGEVRNNALYLLNGDGDVVAGPFSGFGGGGGGGGGSSSATFRFLSATGGYDFTYSNDTQVSIGLTWSSTEDEEPTGNGTLKLTVNGVEKFANKGVPQGTIYENVTGYLRDGDNTLVFQLTDAYGSRKSRTFTVKFLNLRVTSSFDDTVDQFGQIEFPYIPYGELTKTMHFLIDGTQVATATVSSAGRQMTQYLPAQSHGSHILTVYFTGTLNGSEVTSNVLHYDLTCIEANNDNVIITSPFNKSEVDQYSTINVLYRVYTPNSQTSDVVISINGEPVNTLTGVDRTQHTFSYRMDESGTVTISIASGNAAKIFVLTVNEITIGAVAETENLKLYLSSYGRSNNEANPAQWVSDQNGTTVAATFSGFNWVNDGWVLDDEGITVMRVSGNARINIPYQPFATDKRSSGFTIEVDFATRNVRNYDTAILSCMNNNRGFELTSQRGLLNSEGSTINMQYKENEHVRVSFVVEKRTELRLIYCYINGIMSAVTRYPADDNFQQAVPQNITIGSNDATIDIYTIRVYDNDLTMKQVEDNWIADTPNGDLMLTRFGRNNIRDNDEIVINKLPTDLPYMIITCPELPQYKGDKKTCSGSFTDPVRPDFNFTFENCQIDVQGTSSQYYARKNYKMKFNSGFTNSNGVTESKYKLRSDSIAVKTFCMKADVASSEGANNVELVRLYNDTCPYKTPGQLSNSKVRQGIDGFPMVIFWHNPDNNTTTFLGKYNFNNDKGTPEVYGFVEGDESWEMRNSGSNRVLYKDDYFSNVQDDTDEFGNPIAAWKKDFECRYPDDEYDDYTQLKEFVSWVKSTDPAQATNEALDETADFGETTTQEVNGQVVTVPITYTHDTAAYRKAKFRAQLSNYAEIDSVIFYYLFTEAFLMIDSRAKNSFPSFMGTPIESAEESNE